MRKKIFSDVNEIIARLSVWISLPLGIMMCWASKNIEYCSKTSFLDGLGAVSVIFLIIIRKTARDWARKIVIRMTIQQCAFEQYSSCLDRLCPRTTICSKTKSSRREIFSFWQKNIFFLPQFFLDVLDHQSELEIDPTSLYIGKSTWNERFKNVYDGFGILNRCEDPELAEKLGNFLTLSVTNIILTRDL